MGTPLMISVAGVRGIVGETLTPPVVARFSAAFARSLGQGPVVVGRDARRSGPMIYRAVAAGLTAAGRDVIDIGLATTPATQVAVETRHAAGGVILTASHNPAPWNALKFLSDRGEFLDAERGAEVRRRFEADEDLWVGFDRLGGESVEPGALAWHLKRVMDLPFVDLAAIRRRALKVVVDGCASVGGVAVPRLLRELGCQVTELDCTPDGNFTRELEPLPEHLGALRAKVREARADLGVALDPDSDRAAFVDAAGTPLGEEYSLALATQVVLAAKPGPVVTNLSTSRIMDSVCARAGVTLHRTPVGEAHVVAGMRALGAVVGGEGNGGVIVPAAHYGRDGLVAAALVCQALSGDGTTLRALADALPRLSMVKTKLARADEAWDRTAPRLRAAFPDHQADAADGLRLSRGEEWVHIRPSGTEPVVRIIAESPGEVRTRELIETARRALVGA
ncbi:MAG: phosphoglucosamine mutase [Candidatus Eisenbacteria bacterium]|uniref:Phosphoglucosamine mutase n=1 Tax=Eiseniibacteriota bacterium TaxID=2212470 RepID=A0A538U0F0_UNCEI|nr:MAG: phosphoglucosamine mutase [Candidatus Eisenbacteria bacterium]